MPNGRQTVYGPPHVIYYLPICAPQYAASSLFVPLAHTAYPDSTPPLSSFPGNLDPGFLLEHLYGWLYTGPIRIETKK